MPTPAQPGGHQGAPQPDAEWVRCPGVPPKAGWTPRRACDGLPQATAGGEPPGASTVWQLSPVGAPAGALLSATHPAHARAPARGYALAAPWRHGGGRSLALAPGPESGGGARHGQGALGAGTVAPGPGGLPARATGYLRGWPARSALPHPGPTQGPGARAGLAGGDRARETPGPDSGGAAGSGSLRSHPPLHMDGPTVA